MPAKRNRMTKETVPQGFTVPMAAVDMIPVVFFGLSAIRVGALLGSALFITGAAVCLLSGVVKVLWKLIAAISQKNIWPMFVQMRILMPVGFAVMLAAAVAGRNGISGAAILSGVTSFPACVFFILGAVGMALMLVFAFALDSGNPKANWLEQSVNAAAQICFFVGLMLV